MNLRGCEILVGAFFFNFFFLGLREISIHFRGFQRALLFVQAFGEISFDDSVLNFLIHDD